MTILIIKKIVYFICWLFFVSFLVMACLNNLLCTEVSACHLYGFTFN